MGGEELKEGMNMKWSFRFARVMGIELKIHATFILIILLGAMQWSEYGVGGMLFGSLLIALLFVCVTLHELGHSVVAQAFGIPVRQIVLLPIGGIAFLSRNPTQPLQELLIAVAGPAVNVVIASVLGLYLSLYASLGGLSPEQMLQAATAGPSLQTMLMWLLSVNVVLVVFNLIPAFPMDGGRVLRAILGFFMDWTRATNIASIVGQAMAFLLGLLAIGTGNIVLAVIAVFVFFAAGAVRADEQARSILSTRRIGDAYNKHAIWLHDDDHVSQVVDYLLTSYQPDYPVLRRGELIGVVSREQVVQSLARAVGDELVRDVMVREVPRVEAILPLDEVRRTMEQNQSRVVAVFDEGQFKGLVSAEDLSEAMILIAFEQRRRSGSPVGAYPEAYPKPA